ncbi:MAG: WXG100 family type VII secretion target [Chloroflexi bacterium]|nr:WXG100 family type VII secretion target [Chloroflexota bacterium]
MASMVRMDTALGFATADKFNQEADNIQGLINGLNGQMDGLFGTWEGTSRTRFEGEYSASKQDMTRFVQLLHDISQRIRTETQQMVDADNA